MPRVVIVQTHTCQCGREVFEHVEVGRCSGGVTIDFQFELWADANAFALLVEAGILDPSVCRSEGRQDRSSSYPHNLS